MSTIIDLSHSIENGMPVYPGTPVPNLNEACTVSRDGFAELFMQFTSHTGTHIDSPAHIIKNGNSISELAISNFTGKAIKIGCSKHNISLVNVIDQKITQYGLPDFILFHTGWDKYWGDNSYYNGFPLPDKKTFKYLSESGIKGVGIDAISIDPVGSEDLEHHTIILGKGLVIVENLTNLQSLPDSNFDFFCFPLKISNGDGSPVRAVAQFD